MQAVDTFIYETRQGIVITAVRGMKCVVFAGLWLCFSVHAAVNVYAIEKWLQMLKILLTVLEIFLRKDSLVNFVSTCPSHVQYW